MDGALEDDSRMPTNFSPAKLGGSNGCFSCAAFTCVTSMPRRRGFVCGQLPRQAYSVPFFPWSVFKTKEKVGVLLVASFRVSRNDKFTHVPKHART